LSYAAWKLLHVASVVLFLGNIATGVFWAAHAHRSRDFRLIASTFEGISRSDRWFTIPGVFGIVLGGIAAAVVGDLPILGTGWILWPIVLFSISGIIFGARVAPLQRRIADIAGAADLSGDAWDSYDAIYRRWGLWGLLALIAPAIAMTIMVLKPGLPGL
jgi:uncharacterized membrane protein